MRVSYIPEGLAGKVNDRQAYLLSAIKWQVSNKAVKSSGYAPLKLTYLRTVLGRNGAKAAIDSCLAAGWIEQDERWVGGKESMGYRLSKELAGQRLVKRPFDDMTIADRIVKWQAAQITQAINGVQERQYVFDNLGRLDFRTGIKAVLAKHANVDKLNSRIQAVGRVEDRNWWFRADERTGRLFHNASSLSRDCRAKLLIDGQPAAETDIVNSQPFLLGSLYPGPSAERTRYLDLCVAGRFYEEIEGIFSTPFADRDALKVGVYQQILYGNIWHTTQPVFQSFAGVFPILARTIAGMKSGKGGNQRLPLAMQKIEADVVIAGAVGRIMRDTPEWRCLTIHDSLLLPARYAEDAAEIIRQELVNRFGLAPPVKVKLATKN